MVLAGLFSSLLLYLGLGLLALVVTAMLDRILGKERGLLLYVAAIVGLTWFVRPTPPPDISPKSKPLELTKQIQQDPTRLPQPAGDPFSRMPLERTDRNAFQEQSDTNPLPPDRIPEPPSVGLKFPLPPTVPGAGPEARRLYRGALPATKVGDGSKLVDVPADSFSAYVAKPEDIFDWVMLGSTRQYVYIREIDKAKEGSKEFEDPQTGLKWHLALEGDTPTFSKSWKQLAVTFAMIGAEEEAKGKIEKFHKARTLGVNTSPADQHDHWFLRRSVENLFVEACRKEGAPRPEALSVDQLIHVASEMALVGETGKESGEGWRRAVAVLELALEKSKAPPARNPTDVLLPLIEAFRALHDERSILAALSQYVAANPQGAAAASGSTWLGEVFLDRLRLPQTADMLFGQAIALQPAMKEALVGRGDAYTWMGDHRRALEAYHEAARAGARTEVATREAEAFLRLGLLAEAKAAADTALSAAAYDVRALLAKGAVQYASGDVQGARDTFAQASAISGDGAAGAVARRHRAEALYDLGLAEWRLGHGDAARAAFDACESALRAGAGRGRTFDETVSPEIGRAVLQLSAGNVSEAEEALQRAHDQAPTVVYIEVLSGWIAQSQGDSTRARTRFEAALTMEPALHDLDGWLSEVRLQLALASVRAGVPPTESAANFEAATRFAERAAQREAKADPKSTDFAVREALTRLRDEHLTEKRRFEQAKKTAQDILEKVREERRALAIKGYCNYRLGVGDPSLYDECIRNFQQVLEISAPADDPIRLYAQDCLARVKHWQSLEEKILGFETKFSGDWTMSESDGIRVFPDQGWLRFSDASKSGALKDGNPTHPTVFARTEKLFDKGTFELLQLLVQVPGKDKNGGPKNQVTFGVMIQPSGGGTGGLKSQGIGIFWDKGKVAVRVGGGTEAENKTGEVHRKVVSGAEMDWPADEGGAGVRLEIERTNVKDGTFVVRLNGETVLTDKLPAFKEGKGPLEFWIGGWSSQSQNWDLRVDNLRIVRRKS